MVEYDPSITRDRVVWHLVLPARAQKKTASLFSAWILPPGSFHVQRPNLSFSILGDELFSVLDALVLLVQLTLYDLSNRERQLQSGCNFLAKSRRPFFQCS